ncbi:amidohydrolase family protein [Cesiribacter sp. SM1]|uniref:amidohydrolase family protein n=1 Tax=Cesiribacter sp. SM1 TaxID=2861196 RepID=UPI001CD7DB27|nr:amidohydrolase family protein [Cesiribacter sp. SM1]
MKKLQVFFLLAVLFSFSCVNRARENSNSAYTGPIIDMHMHAYNTPNPLFGEASNPVTGEKRYGSENPASHKEETFEIMEKHNIVLGVVSSPDGKNKVLKEWSRSKPGKILIGQSVVDPDKLNADSVRLYFKRGDVDIIGEVMPNYAGILPNDQRLKKVFDLAEELEVPIGFHLFPGGPAGGAYFAYPLTRASQAKPLQMEELLISHPKVKVYIMHAGWPFLEDMKALMYAHPQVHVDVSVISWNLPRQEFHNYLKGLVDAGFAKRIMFGSDQMTWPAEIANGIEAVNAAPFLSIQQKADIFYFNAANFLELPKGVINQHQNSMVHK